MTDRKNPPTVKTSEKLLIKKPEKISLNNGIPAFVFNSGDQDVIKIDFILQGGAICHANPLIPEAANSLLEAGTYTYSSAQIAESFDYYGAYLDLYIGKHTAQLSLYTLNKYLDETLDLTIKLITEAVYPDHEIDIWLRNRYNNYLINRQKSEIVSKELFMEALFGKNHPYGRQIKDDDFNTITRDELMSFYKIFYNISSLVLVLSGKVCEEQLNITNKHIGSLRLDKPNEFPSVDLTITDHNQGKEVFLPIENAVQSAINFGTVSLHRCHADYPKLHITSIILGGYFGSRLMTNIREDKGYTYGIYSALMSLPEYSIFLISAQSGKDVYKSAIKEVRKEIDILRNKRISEDELLRVKRWMSGSLSKTFDGAFALADAFKSLLPFGLSFEYYENYFETLKSVNAEDIMQIAKKYLNSEEMNLIVAGAI